MERQMRTLRQSNKGRTTDEDSMSHQRKGERIWYATIAGLRIISTGSALNLRDKIMCHNIQTQDNSKLDIPLRVQERVHRKDNNSNNNHNYNHS